MALTNVRTNAALSNFKPVPSPAGLVRVMAALAAPPLTATRRSNAAGLPNRHHYM